MYIRSHKLTLERESSMLRAGFELRLVSTPLIDRSSMSESSHRKRPRAMTRTTSKGEIAHEVQTENHDESRRAKISSDASSTCIESKSTKEDGEKKVGELSQPLDFLHSCGACGRPLGLERDIYIYRCMI